MRIIISLLILNVTWCYAGLTKDPVSEEPGKTQVAPGVTYIHTYDAKTRYSVHVIIADLLHPNIRLRVAKGLDNIAGLERVGSIIERVDSVNPGSRTLAGVNANFWKAGTNHPMGPTAIEGEILKARKYKNWSSVAVGKSGKVYIDTFDLKTFIRTRYGDVEIDRYNLRKDSLSVVVYSRYFGNSVPFIDTLGIMEASEDTITDDSEAQNIVNMAIDSLWGSIPEAGTLKMQFEYVRQPLVNTFTTCRVTDIDTGIVAIPPNGGVISFGRGSFPLFFSLFVGDTFSLVSQLQPVLNEPVVQMSGGTPRLVRAGKASVEWQEEGLRKKRFVTGRYGRSSIGVSQDKSKLILITVEQYRRRSRTRGISLPNLAELHLKYGSWDAMNLDGGSSTTMVVDGQVVTNNRNPRTRKISTTFLVQTKLESATPSNEPQSKSRKEQ